jgi:CheY-specific phosphatase CheX
MIKELKSAMTASISEVLETMFYMPLEFDDAGLPPKGGVLETPDLRICRMTFSGSFRGYFLLLVPECLLTSMAEDFMGEDRENITPQHTDGIIKEVLNMVAGHMFSNMGEKKVFDLGIPEIVEDRSVIDSIANTPPECMVTAESIDGCLMCIIYLDA